MGKTVRLWTRHRGSFVRLRLEEGKRITIHEGGPHEEGYTYTANVLELEKAETVDPLNIVSGYIVTLDSYTESRDCDGRLDSSEHLYCPIEQLEDLDLHTLYPGQGYEGTPRLPIWAKNRDGEFRDYAAEAAGY